MFKFFSLLLLVIAGACQASVFIPGSTMKPMACNEPVQGSGGGINITESCSPLFYTHCFRYRTSTFAYFPNCITSQSQFDANDAFQPYVSMINSLNRPDSSNATKECLEELVPLLCNAFYPLYHNFSYLAPCIGHCQSVFSKCMKAGVPVHRSSWNCTTMFDTNCPAIKDGDIKCMEPCKAAKPEPPSCFKECNSSAKPAMKVCTKKERKCSASHRHVKPTVSGKQFGRFEFGAKVEVLEQVHLCEPKNSIAYKVKVLHDYFLDCKNCRNTSQEVTSGSIIYVLTNDTVDTCEERCIENLMTIGEKYFIMGQLDSDYLAQCGTKVWILHRTKINRSVIYLWSKVLKDKKDKRNTLYDLALDNFACKWPCKRSSISCNN